MRAGADALKLVRSTPGRNFGSLERRTLLPGWGGQQWTLAVTDRGWGSPES